MDEDAVKKAAEISIHVPREGHDLAETVPSMQTSPFQSTCPARGTTIAQTVSGVRTPNFNPRAPRGARRDTRGDYRAAAEISIHVPREGHDMNFCSSRN